MSNARKTTKESTRDRNRSRFAQVGRSVSAAVGVDRTTAIQLLNACVAAEMKCMREIVGYLGDDSPRTKRLLEEVLALEKEHAEELIHVLQGHRAEHERAAFARPVLLAL